MATCARIEAGDPGSEEELHEEDGERGDRRAGHARRAVLARSRELPKVESDPDQGAHDREGEQQVRRKAEMADVRPVDQAGHDHVPAQRALQPAEDEQADELPAIALRDRALRREPDQRQREGHADQAADQPVEPLPEEDELELRQRHSGRPVDLEIFRRLLVELEGMLPVGLRQRRDRAGDGLPLRDRQAAFGQAGDPADHDHQEDQSGDGQEPVGNCERPLRPTEAVPRRRREGSSPFARAYRTAKTLCQGPPAATDRAKKSPM